MDKAVKIYENIKNKAEQDPKGAIMVGAGAVAVSGILAYGIHWFLTRETDDAIKAKFDAAMDEYTCLSNDYALAKMKDALAPPNPLLAKVQQTVKVLRADLDKRKIKYDTHIEFRFTQKVSPVTEEEQDESEKESKL